MKHELPAKIQGKIVHFCWLNGQAIFAVLREDCLELVSESAVIKSCQIEPFLYFSRSGQFLFLQDHENLNIYSLLTLELVDKMPGKYHSPASLSCNLIGAVTEDGQLATARL